MAKWNPNGIMFATALATAGYCFGGHIGLGIAACIIAAIQLA